MAALLPLAALGAVSSASFTLVARVEPSAELSVLSRSESVSVPLSLSQTRTVRIGSVLERSTDVNAFTVRAYSVNGGVLRHASRPSLTIPYSFTVPKAVREWNGDGATAAAVIQRSVDVSLRAVRGAAPGLYSDLIYFEVAAP
ncbi:MAG: hypothetical protein NDJ90_15710 [Oligoflexia bacterium]|nr:hypothetical protein [Oligoflexia bacterium]